MTNAECIRARMREEILEVLGNVEEHAQPWVPELALSDVGSGACDAIGQDAYDIRREILAELKADGLIEERWGAFSSGEVYALCRHLEHPEYIAAEEGYAKLKQAVFDKARCEGLNPGWSLERGWALFNRGDETVVRGNMRRLAEYLGIQAAG